jgi:hypothetical protein
MCIRKKDRKKRHRTEVDKGKISRNPKAASASIDLFVSFPAFPPKAE